MLVKFFIVHQMLHDSVIELTGLIVQVCGSQFTWKGIYNTFTINLRFPFCLL